MYTLYTYTLYTYSWVTTVELGELVVGVAVAGNRLVGASVTVTGDGLDWVGVGGGTSTLAWSNTKSSSRMSSSPSSLSFSTLPLVLHERGRNQTISIQYVVIHIPLHSNGDFN